MASTDELRMIERDVDKMRELISLHRRLLAEQLAPHGAGPDIIDELLTDCDEWGVAHVMNRLAENPGQLNLTELPPARLATVGKLLDQLSDTSIDFDRLVVTREAILTEADPNRQRVYPWFGREFTLDAAGRTLRFADRSEAEQMTVAAMPNRIAPMRQPDVGMAPVRPRRPDRDR